ncbi:DUF1146 family protein, partial [Staphylococcus aureus]|uniref:DUF1146 family protein n=1 Tax=Staphylococcus aureus TaxID=1280 RepID=UPI001C1FEF88
MFCSFSTRYIDISFTFGTIGNNRNDIITDFHDTTIYISFWALQSLRIEQFFKTQFTPQIRMLMVFFAIAIGY